jgi:glycosyltransferase involved in cell wall biosynthesis
MRDIYRDPRVLLILAVSQSIARQITTAIGEECAQKVVVVPSGTDLKRFRPLPKDLGIVNEFQLAFNRVVGMVAHVRPYKRVDVYLEASKMVNQSMPDVKFLVVGKIGLPDLRVAARILHQRVEQERGLFCIGNVVYTDMRDDIPRIMSTFDVSVSCSDRFEGVSGAIRESLAMGIPVVCTEVGGNTELVKDGVTGYLVPPGDAQALAEKICFILENRELAKKTASVGRLYVSHHLSQERRNERIWSLYRSLIGR